MQTKKVCCGLFLCCCFSLAVFQHQSRALSESEISIHQATINRLQIPFIENRGQAPEHVRYYAQIFSGTVFVTDSGDIGYALVPQSCLAQQRGTTSNPMLVVTEEFIGAQFPELQGVYEAQLAINYHSGSDPSQWCSHLSAYHALQLGEIMPGIKLRLAAYSRTVEKLFFVAPGAKVEQLRVKMHGCSGLIVNDEGELVVSTAAGNVTFTKPLAYQLLPCSTQNSECNSFTKKFVDIAYVVQTDEYGFQVGEYDASSLLIIDPLLASTLLGGSSQDGLNYTDVNLAISADGFVYIAGPTSSTNFPITPGVYDAQHNGGSDIFVAKLNGDLTTLYSCTFIGGNVTDEARAIAVDNVGNIYLAGITESHNFPVTENAYQKNYGGGTNSPYGSGDLFVVKFDHDLTSLLASTYLGGNGHDCCNALSLDQNGNVFVSGATSSMNFPISAGAYQSTRKTGGTYGDDIFISKFDGNLSTLMASTYIGGTGDDFSEAMAIDGNGNVCIGGWITSTNFPTAVDAYDRSYSGGAYDAIVAKLNSDLSSLIGSTFLGGTAWDFVYGMALDQEDNIYVTGHTASTNFPVSSQAYDRTYNGLGGQGVGDDVFITKLNSTLTQLKASTYLGGSAWDNGYALLVSKNGAVYGAGTTSSNNFPATTFAYDTTYAGGTRYTGDVYLLRLDSDLSMLEASTYLGGSGNEGSGTIAIDDAGAVYFCGSTSSANFPTTDGAYDQVYNGGTADVFIVKLDSLLSTEPLIPGIGANPATGHAPLTIQFSDQSKSIEPITSWEWDFTNDGVVDSRDQHPTWLYAAPGVYSVTLTVHNSSGSKSTTALELIHVFDGESALQFTSDACYAKCPAAPGLNLAAAVTIEAWIKPTNWGSMSSLVDKNSISLLIGGENSALNDHSLALWHSTTSGQAGFICSPVNTIVLHEWQHVALCYDGNSNAIRLLINGVEQELTYFGGQPTGSLNDNAALDLTFGNAISRGRPYPGIIDEVRIWNIARSAVEIQENMNRYLTGAETGLVGYWQMNEGNGTIIADSTANKHDGALTNANWAQGIRFVPSALTPTSNSRAPHCFRLYENYPNPFNAETTIRFDLAQDTFVQLAIYNNNGKLVKSLIREMKSVGHHAAIWNGTDDDDHEVSSGVYFYKLISDDFRQSQKMLFLK